MNSSLSTSKRYPVAIIRELYGLAFEDLMRIDSAHIVLPEAVTPLLLLLIERLEAATTYLSTLILMQFETCLGH